MKEYNKIRTLWARSSERPHNMVVGQFDNPIFAALQDVQWVFTEKLDGTNIRIMWDGHKVTFGGRTDRAQIPATLLEVLLEMFGGEANEQVFENVFGETPACLYGEGIGPGIQKGGGLYGKINFVLFDVMVGDVILERPNVVDVAAKFDIEIAEVVGTGNLLDLSNFVADGFNSYYGDFVCEGVVARPTVELKDRMGRRIITKLKHKDFLKLEQVNS
jgi:hypothetical protein